MKKIILILLSLCLTLGLAGCSAPKATPKSDAESAYLEAQKSSSILPGKLTISETGDIKDLPVTMNLEGALNSKESFLVTGISSSPGSPVETLHVKMYGNINSTYFSIDNGENWKKTDEDFSFLDDIKQLSFKNIKSAKKDTIKYNGKERSVYKYELDLPKSFDSSGLYSLLIKPDDPLSREDQKNITYNIYIDSKTKQVVEAEIKFSDNLGNESQVTYRADENATFEKPTNL